jgi:hypothetical protein
LNRSGIIKTGGVIGGKAQTGSYLIDCRFNKEDLEARLRRIAKYASRITFTSIEVGAFLDKMEAIYRIGASYTQTHRTLFQAQNSIQAPSGRKITQSSETTSSLPTGLGS